jgi:hypothetical protein
MLVGGALHDRGHVAALLDSTGGGEDLLPTVAALAAFASLDAARGHP